MSSHKRRRHDASQWAAMPPPVLRWLLSFVEPDEREAGAARVCRSWRAEALAIPVVELSLAPNDRTFRLLGQWPPAAALVRWAQTLRVLRVRDGPRPVNNLTRMGFRRLTSGLALEELDLSECKWVRLLGSDFLPPTALKTLRLYPDNTTTTKKQELLLHDALDALQTLQCSTSLITAWYRAVPNPRLACLRELDLGRGVHVMDSEWAVAVKEMGTLIHDLSEDVVLLESLRLTIRSFTCPPPATEDGAVVDRVLSLLATATRMRRFEWNMPHNSVTWDADAGCITLSTSHSTSRVADWLRLATARPRSTWTTFRHQPRSGAGEASGSRKYLGSVLLEGWNDNWFRPPLIVCTVGRDGVCREFDRWARAGSLPKS